MSRKPRANKAARELLGEIRPTRGEQIGTVAAALGLFYLLIREVFKR